jgi:serine/threonine-protein kinase
VQPAAREVAFGRYQLIATLGHGGMADVYLAVARGPVGFNKLLVIKHLRPHLAEEPEFLTMFLDEARLAARLSHPNVVQTNEVGEVGGHYFIAMEYLEGQPLNRIFQRMRRAGEANFTLEMGLAVISEALAGLHYAHELCDYDGSPLGVVHRDVSPHNVFVTYDGRAKLVDFGIAKAATRSADTRTGVMKGKVVYMSPEQARCEPVDRRADIFSVGVILWELAARRRLWATETDFEVLARLEKADVPRLEHVAPSLPPELYRVCARALAIDPAERYPSAGALRDDIEQLFTRSLRRPRHDEIGELVSIMFADRRAALQDVVDAQLRNLTIAQRRGAEVAIVDLGALVATGPVGLPSADIHGRNEGTPSKLTASHAPMAMTPMLSSPPAAPASGHKLAIALGAGACVAVGVIAAVVLLGGEPRRDLPQAHASATAASAAVPAPAPSSAAPARSVRLSVEVTPPGARIHLDGRPLEHNPYEPAADGSRHLLVIEADGYAPHEREIVFDRDHAIVVALVKSSGKPEAKKGSPPATPPQPAAAADPAPQPAPQPPSQPGGFSDGPGKPKPRPLDTSDPWGK